MRIFSYRNKRALRRALFIAGGVLLLLLALPLLLALVVGTRALLVVEGEMEREAGAFALLTLDLHPAAMAIDDFLHDRKPDA